MRTTATRLRPLLRPGLAVLWRGATTIQIGVDERIAVTIEQADDRVRHALTLFDGARTLGRIQADARACGMTPHTLGELLAVLEGAGILTWNSARVLHRRDAYRPSDHLEDARLAPDVAARGLASLAIRRADPDHVHSASPDDGDDGLGMRALAWVDVVGAGRVGGAVAELLAAGGIGRVTLTDARHVTAADLAPIGPDRGDLGGPRDEAHRRRIADLAPATRTVPDTGSVPTVTVLAHDGGPDAFLADAWSRTGIPHVAAFVREHVGHVGPFVIPGRTTCLHCIDLHRADRDPGWARIATQLAEPGVATPACDVTLATLVAAQATLEVLAYTDGARTDAGGLGALTSRGAVLQTTLPGAATLRRRWPPHPRCHCGAATAYDGPGGYADRRTGQQLLAL